MAELLLKVSEEKYKSSLDDLQRQLGRLNEIKNSLEGRKDQLGNSLKEALGTKASEMLETNLRNVNSSIEKTQSAIDEIQHYLDTMQSTESELSGKMAAATEEARKLFD